jgi:hypothetical protein
MVGVTSGGKYSDLNTEDSAPTLPSLKDAIAVAASGNDYNNDDDEKRDPDLPPLVLHLQTNSQRSQRHTLAELDEDSSRAYAAYAV